MNRFLVLLLALAPSTLEAETQLRGSPEELQKFLKPAVHTVTLRGHALEKAYADTAHVVVVVKTEESSLSASLQRNAALREQLVASFASRGIPADDIKTSEFSASPQYGWFSRKPSRYEVINRMTVTVHNDGQLTMIAKAADGAEEFQIGDIEFEHSHKTESEAKVRRLALEDAIKRKKEYETMLGVELKPVEFSFDDARPTATRGGHMMEEIVVTAERAGGSKEKEAPGAVTQAPTFQEVQYESNVTVTFEVRQP